MPESTLFTLIEAAKASTVFLSGSGFARHCFCIKCGEFSKIYGKYFRLK
jgi:hypothetical protein